MLEFDGEYPAVHPKAKFLKKSAVKHSMEKPILLNFVNLSPNLCPRLQSNIYDETFTVFSRSPFSQKSSIVDVLLGSLS